MVSFRINGLRRFHARVCRWLHARHATSLCIQTLSVWYRYICKHCRLQCPVPRVWYLFCIRCSSHQSSFNNPRSTLTRLKTDVTYIRHPSALNRKALPVVALPSSYSTRQRLRTCYHATCCSCIKQGRVAYTGGCCEFVPGIRQ